MAIKSTNLSWITVSDIKKAKEFYVNKLGLILEEESEFYPWLELRAPDSSYRLGVAQENKECGEKPGINAIMTFEVDNIESEIERFKKEGIVFTDYIMEVPGHVKMISFIDADRNKFQLCEILSKNKI